MEPRTRLELIAKSYRYCGDVVTREALRVQFHYETGSDPSSHDLDLVLRQFAHKEEKPSLLLFDGVDPKPLAHSNTLADKPKRKKK